ncbi:hypothetical protein, partial [Acidisphaera sp. S103]|uniref:hypothetical protein n=1 Tax=Acidisphaera sp. S103 TaxID=1747223 RepID=UPI001C2063CD
FLHPKDVGSGRSRAVTLPITRLLGSGPPHRKCDFVRLFAPMRDYLQLHEKLTKSQIGANDRL